MDFKVVFYKDSNGGSPIEDFLLKLWKSNKELVTKARSGIEKLRNRFYHREPLSKYIEPSLWELRVKSRNDILRIIYTFRKEQVIILLHAFVKKQQKTPLGELEQARRRLKELKQSEIS